MYHETFDFWRLVMIAANMISGRGRLRVSLPGDIDTLDSFPT